MKTGKPSRPTMRATIANTLPFDSVWRSFERTQRAENRSERTIETYRDCKKLLERWARESEHELALDALDKEALEEFFIFLRARLANTTLRTHYAQMNRFFNWAVDEGIVDESPMRRMRAMKREEPAAPPVLSVEQMRAILGVCEGKTFAARRDMAMFRLLFDCGLRRGEMGSLTVSGIDWDTSTVTITGKRKTRVMRFGHKTGRDIDRYLLVRSRHAYAHLDALWLGQVGKLSDGGLYAIMRRRARQAGVERFWPHVGRHTFADQFLAAGGQEGDLMELAGWSTRTMLGVYGRGRRTERALAAQEKLSLGDRL